MSSARPILQDVELLWPGAVDAEGRRVPGLWMSHNRLRERLEAKRQLSSSAQIVYLA
jgi:hypothetical protein